MGRPVFLEDELADLAGRGPLRRPQRIDGEPGPAPVCGGRRVVNLGSHDLLGLASDPRVREAAARAARDLGPTSSGARATTGYLKLHGELEERLAELERMEAALLFPSALTAGIGVLDLLADHQGAIVHDAECSPELLASCRAAVVDLEPYRSDEVGSLDAALDRAEVRPGRSLLVAEGLHPLDGRVAALDSLATVAADRGAFFVVFEGLGTGVLGTNGRGSLEHWGIHDAVTAVVGSLAGPLAAGGGFLAADRTLVDVTLSRCPLQQTLPSVSPADCAAALAALDALDGNPAVLERLWLGVERFDRELSAASVATVAGGSPVTLLPLQAEADPVEVARRLLEAGVLLVPKVSTAPRAPALRAAVTAAHSAEQLSRAVQAIAGVTTAGERAPE